MRFTWQGVLLAPLAVPIVFSTAMAFVLGGAGWVAFLIMMIPSCIISYGTTICLFLPALAVLSRFHRPTVWSVAGLGLALGIAVMVPLTFIEWKSSGADSGPPEEPFLAFARRWIFEDQFSLVCPLAGLVTAALYWALATGGSRQREPGKTG